MTNDFWNDRFGQKEFVYGEAPNKYLKDKLKNLTPGKILLPADGEGRNGVYAATLGWKVSCFDPSIEGKKKAESLAAKNKVSIDYNISDAENAGYPKESFDAMALIFSHFPEEKRTGWHKHFSSFLKKGGALIVEVFSKKQLEYQKKNPTAGGPKELNMLYDLERLKKDFPGYTFKEAYETETELHEGKYHEGKGSVIRIFAIKN